MCAYEKKSQSSFLPFGRETSQKPTAHSQIFISLFYQVFQDIPKTFMVILERMKKKDNKMYPSKPISLDDIDYK